MCNSRACCAAARSAAGRVREREPTRCRGSPSGGERGEDAGELALRPVAVILRRLARSRLLGSGGQVAVKLSDPGFPRFDETAPLGDPLAEPPDLAPDLCGIGNQGLAHRGRPFGSRLSSLPFHVASGGMVPNEMNIVFGIRSGARAAWTHNGATPTCVQRGYFTDSTHIW